MNTSSKEQIKSAGKSLDVLKNFEMDRYNGIIIKDMQILPDTDEDFDRILQECIPIWRSRGASSIQIFFKPPKCHLMNVASKHGFYFHHA